MDRWSAELLEYGALKALLGRFVSSPAGHQHLDRVEPLEARSSIVEILAETAEAMAYVDLSSKPQPATRGAAVRLRFDSIPEMSVQTAKLAIDGSVLEGKEILDLTRLLDQASIVRSILTAAAERFPRLGARAAGIAEFRPVLDELAGKILPDGSVADNASVALHRIRRDMERQQRTIQESLERFLRAHRDDGVLQEEFVAIRNERFVVPVVSGQKKKVEGVIHAASGTGHTLFIEPLETIELNNDLVRLREQEMREVFRILQEMTLHLRGMAGEIEEAASALAHFDFLFAKARFAAEFGCVIPTFSPDGAPRLSLSKARHPLLADVFARQQRNIVPLNLTLEGTTRTLLISGPNTGGKTVALKTIGMFALMAQSGMPVPCEDAELPLFEQVLADIGDNQSIEQSLSTFSAHVTRIGQMLEMAGPRSLVLLDELGRATDPEEGGALGVAIVDHMRQLGAFTLASTHLVAPKIYGANTEGVLNGSMSFHEATLAPTYRLRTGAPGSSAGLDIAQRLGLPAALIAKARQSLTGSQRDMAKFLQVLEERLDEVTRLEAELRQTRAALETERADLKQIWDKRESAKLKELERRSELMLEQFAARGERTIAEILADAEQKKAAAKARRQVSQTRRELKEEFDTTVLATREESRTGQLDRPTVSEGARVQLKGVREPARVRRLLANGAIEVEAGFLKLQVDLEDVLEVLPDSSGTAKAAPSVTLKAGPSYSVLTQELNIIGKRAEEACEEVDRFLDHAILANVDRVRIIHGHGMGILKRAVAELLKAHPHVSKHYLAGPEEGGAGATIAELNVVD